MTSALNLWLEGGDTFALRTPYSERLLERVRPLQGRRWDPTRKVWLVPARHAAEVARLVEDFELAADDQAVACWDPARAALLASEHLSEAKASGFNVEGLARELRPFQRAGVEYATSRPGTLIADDMGLGKTCQAIATVHHLQAYPALVVCPAILKENWRREILSWLPNASVEVLSGFKTKPRPLVPQWTIANYDIIHAQGPTLPTPGALVCDESHLIKERSSRRTRAVLELSARTAPDALRLCLTGTPILSKPVELETQLEVLGQLPAFGGALLFEQSFCNRRVETIYLRKPPRPGEDKPRVQAKHVLKLDGATNLAVLNTLLKQRCMVRRLKADVLTELPPKVRSVHWGTEPAEVYAREEAHARQELREKALELAKACGVSLDELEQAQEWVGFCADQLGMLAKLRRALALAKVPMVIRFAEAMLGGGCDKLVIFGHHRELTTGLAEHFACPRVLGGMSDRERQGAVDAFQSPDGPRVIVCSIQAAGVGLTLHAASNVLMAELAWTPAALDQAEDRLHRLGQRGSVTAWYTLVPGTIDAEMWDLLERKRGIVGAVTDGALQRELLKRMVRCQTTQGSQQP